MKNARKVLSALLATSLLMSLTACNKHEETVATVDPSVTTSSGTIDKLEVSSSSEESSQGELTEEMKHYDFDGDGVLNEDEMGMYILDGYMAENGTSIDATNMHYIEQINEYRVELERLEELDRKKNMREDILTNEYRTGIDDILESTNTKPNVPMYDDWDFEECSRTGIIPAPYFHAKDSVNGDPSCKTKEDAKRTRKEFLQKEPSYFNAYRALDYTSFVSNVDMQKAFNGEHVENIISPGFGISNGVGIWSSYGAERFDFFYDALSEDVVYCSNEDYTYFWVLNPEKLWNNDGATASCDLLEPETNLIRHFDITNLKVHPDIVEYLESDKKNGIENNSVFYDKQSIVLIGDMSSYDSNELVPVEIAMTFANTSRSNNNKITMRFQYGFDSPVQEVIGEYMVRCDGYDNILRDIDE